MNWGLLGGILLFIIIGVAGIYSFLHAWRVWRWPRTQARIVEHKVLFISDTSVKVTFTDKTGHFVEAILSDEDDQGLAFLSDKPVGGIVEVCYNPKISTQVFRPRGLTRVIFVALLTLPILFTIVRSIILVIF